MHPSFPGGPWGPWGSVVAQNFPQGADPVDIGGGKMHFDPVNPGTATRRRGGA